MLLHNVPASHDRLRGEGIIRKLKHKNIKYTSLHLQLNLFTATCPTKLILYFLPALLEHSVNGKTRSYFYRE
jgi:hypothetical protein